MKSHITRKIHCKTAVDQSPATSDTRGAYTEQTAYANRDSRTTGPLPSHDLLQVSCKTIKGLGNVNIVSLRNERQMTSIPSLRFE